MIKSLLNIQPKDSGSSTQGKSREEEVKERLENHIIPILPADLDEAEIQEKLKNADGPDGLGQPGQMQNLPMNIYLGTELQRL